MSKNIMIETFFESLSERMSNENDLSDITYALCNTDDDFRKLFLKFCFDDDVDTLDLVREYAEDDSRPDFFFHGKNNQEYIIEVKIHDRNQHFDQYNKQFPNAKYAFISNYILNENELCNNDKNAIKEKNWKIRTWKGLYNRLIKSKVKSELVDGYILYLKNVINIKEFIKMDLKKITNLPVFLEDISKIFTDKGFIEYKGNKSMSEYYYGKFFTKNDFYFWFGLFFSEDTYGNPKIFIGMKEDEYWIPKKISSKFKAINCSKNKDSVIERIEYDPVGNYGDYWFNIKPELVKIFCNDNSTKEKEQEILEIFIQEVFHTIGADDYLK